jgi:hypothetical protein
MPENLERISNKVANLKSDLLSPEVAVSDNIKEYENKEIVFSFGPYNQNQCELHTIQKPEAKKLTKELKAISKTLLKHFRNQGSGGSNIACKPIHNSGNYSVLFESLPPDIDEIMQIDYSSAGRIFGFLINNIFNVVTIGKKHK